MNPFSSSYPSDQNDLDLVERALEGNRKALNKLIDRHQAYIYNLAWKMSGDPTDAADLTQEVLVKIVSNLGTFRFESSFRTWAYRIAVNHFISGKNKPNSIFPTDFKAMGEALDAAPMVELSKEEAIEKEEEIWELRLSCLSGMLLCLSTEQRMVYLIGEVFGADHTIGSELMSISKTNFRMKLSKARKDLYQFMTNKCGLVNKENPCRCRKKVTVAIEAQMIDAKDLLHNKKEYTSFRELIKPDVSYLIDDASLKYAELHRDYVFKEAFEKKNFLTEILEDMNWKKGLNLN